MAKAVGAKFGNLLNPSNRTLKALVEVEGLEKLREREEAELGVADSLSDVVVANCRGVRSTSPSKRPGV
jgi:hypothetical protein